MTKRNSTYATSGVDRQFRICRLWSNHELRKVAPLLEGRIVNVSAADDDDKEGGIYFDYFPKKISYSITNYPGYRGFRGREGEIELDLEKELPEDLVGSFDVVFNHTTLEHIFDARIAFRNLCQLTSDILIVVVPFAQVQHYNESFGDFWRFTPHSMRRLFEENDMEIIYESESPDVDAGVYLFHVGSRKATKWRSLFPDFEDIEYAGEWLGKRKMSIPKQFARAVKQRLKRNKATH